jgi:hypothetical protein
MYVLPREKHGVICLMIQVVLFQIIVSVCSLPVYNFLSVSLANLLNELIRVYSLAFVQHFKMDMGGGSPARGSHFGDFLTGNNAVTGLHQ